MPSNAVYPSLANKTALVTGGGSGIGEAITRALVNQGTKVGFLDFDESVSKRLVEELKTENILFEFCDLRDVDVLKRTCEESDIPVRDDFGAGKLQIEIFEKTLEPHLSMPTIVTQYPAEVSPLARCNDEDSFVTDRFELFMGGREIANGFSELNDPEDQARRFKAQVEAKSLGDEEAMFYDADYIRALEYGMPPAAGLGIGIDRLVMLLTDSSSIREVVLFPHLRPEA